jgi:hypothetical protein
VPAERFLVRGDCNKESFMKASQNGANAKQRKAAKAKASYRKPKVAVYGSAQSLTQRRHHGPGTVTA